VFSCAVCRFPGLSPTMKYDWSWVTNPDATSWFLWPPDCALNAKRRCSGSTGPNPMTLPMGAKYHLAVDLASQMGAHTKRTAWIPLSYHCHPNRSQVGLDSARRTQLQWLHRDAWHHWHGMLYPDAPKSWIKWQGEDRWKIEKIEARCRMV
jgi:hypothetical protein